MEEQALSDMEQLLWRAIWHYLSEISMHIPFYPTMPLVGIYTRGKGHVKMHKQR